MVAILVLAILVSVLGTGRLGVAAAHVRSSGSQQHGPLRLILRPSDHRNGGDFQSLQRDRARLRPGR